MLIDDENRIKWDKLEELISIASNAGAALATDDFSALKRAQEQSDLVMRFNRNSVDKNGISRTRFSSRSAASTLAIPERVQGGSSDASSSSDMSFDMIVLVMDYLLSEQGSFLLDPLITDIAGIVGADYCMRRDLLLHRIVSFFYAYLSHCSLISIRTVVRSLPLFSLTLLFTLSLCAYLSSVCPRSSPTQTPSTPWASPP